MLSKNFAIAIAVVLAMVCLAEAREEGPQDMAGALRMLQELDRYYTQAARPRVSNAMQCCVDQCRSSIQRGIYCSCENCWLQLSNRFGKRSDAFTNWAKDVEKPELPAWLAYAKRR